MATTPIDNEVLPFQETPRNTTTVRTMTRPAQSDSWCSWLWARDDSSSSRHSQAVTVVTRPGSAPAKIDLFSQDQSQPTRAASPQKGQRHRQPSDEESTGSSCQENREAERPNRRYSYRMSAGSHCHEEPCRRDHCHGNCSCICARNCCLDEFSSREHCHMGCCNFHCRVRTSGAPCPCSRCRVVQVLVERGTDLLFQKLDKYYEDRLRRMENPKYARTRTDWVHDVVGVSSIVLPAALIAYKVYRSLRSY